MFLVQNPNFAPDHEDHSNLGGRFIVFALMPKKYCGHGGRKFRPRMAKRKTNIISYQIIIS
jgi:hypothetical protein